MGGAGIIESCLSKTGGYANSQNRKTRQIAPMKIRIELDIESELVDKVKRFAKKVEIPTIDRVFEYALEEFLAGWNPA